MSLRDVCCAKGGAQIPTRKRARRLPLAANDPITKQELFEVIKEIKVEKAAGPDLIAPFMIKYGGEAMIDSLLELLTFVWNTGSPPRELFRATVVTIPKKERQ